MSGLEESIQELEEKMKHDWRLRWYYRKEVIKLDISEWWIGFYRRLWKWLVCSWKHKSHHCHPQDPNGYWHCEECHPCDEMIKKEDFREKAKEVISR